MKKTTRSYDGSKRKAQAEARKQHIVACAAELLLAHTNEELTLEAVAKKAETTVQTILRNFGSRDGLMIATLEIAGPADSDRRAFGVVSEHGIAGAVERLFGAYEQVGDLVIRLLAEEHRSSEIHKAVEVGRIYHKDWVRMNFGPWLDSKSPTERSTLFHALLTSTDIYVWKILRRDEALGRKSSVASVVLTIEALLGENSDD